MTTQPARSGPSRTIMESNLPLPRNPSAADDSSGSIGKLPERPVPESDGRVRKVQKTTSGTDRKTTGNSIVSAPRPPPANLRADIRGRRQSFREQHKEQHKVPLGPRPLDLSKPRVTSEASAATASIAANAVNRSFLPTSTSEPAFAHSTLNSTSNSTTTRAANPRFSFGQHSDSSKEHTGSSGSYDFLPSVNFDEFHASISSYEPNLSDFPAPGGGGGVGIFPTAPTTVPATQVVTYANMRADALAPGTGTEARPARSTALMRRFSQSRTASNPLANSPLADTPSMAPPATSMSIRTRRQSHFPPQAPPNPTTRGPRKSMGPGMLPSNFDVRDVRQEAPKLPNDGAQGGMGRTASFSKGTRRPTLSTNLSVGTESPKASNPARSAKAKSMQVPSRQQAAFLSTAAMTPEHIGGVSLHPARSPGRTPAQRTQTPSSSSSKRQSHHHATGLGARTISPTDARRLKRLSMNPNPPGGPVSPPTPQADFPFDEQTLNQSPAMLFRKSVTPSSARATPDQNQNRKSYASGISLSSNSSLNSLKLATSSLQPRNSTLSGSRLPTPKARNDHGSTAGDELEVPPVPAIPKAYESPKDSEHSGFSFAMPPTKPSALATSTQDRSDTAAVDSSELSNVEDSGVESSKPGIEPTPKSTIRHRRGLTVGSGSTEVDTSPSVPHTNKKNLQPIRLPPLNLLPLGTPFNNRISSFSVPSAESDDRNTTPPPKRSNNKTPSTPMTASKASFFSKSNHSDHYDTTPQLRSSSSAFNLRPAEPSLHGASAMPIPILNPARMATTPFASNSLPKGSGEFARLYSRPSGEYNHSNTDVEMQSMKVNGPRALTNKETAPSAQPSTAANIGTPPTGISLRRKLSLGGWRRSSSKTAAQGSQPQGAQLKPNESTPQAPKHGEMPPPRLPASATWAGNLGASPTPTNRSRPSLDFARRKPSTATVASDTDGEKPNSHKPNGISNARIPSAPVEHSGGQPTQRSSSSILTPMQRMLGARSSSNVLKARNLDPNLDRDDLVADEEMKKLASKRKDFEHAARDVDELRKRAKPQERVTAAQAIQMVSLNIFERGEIIDYKEIYFCGTKTAKKHVGDLNQQTLNFGYDDERGDYNIVLGDHLAYRYEVVDLLGKGSFGQVVRCVDHKTGQLVAIKIIRNKKRFHQQALVEVNILQKLREWDPDNKHSMINFTQSFYFRGHLCISTELLGMNLYEFIKAHEFKGFSLRLIRRFCKQMLSSLVLLKSHRVIHCDLKPENILLAHPLHSEIKTIDFGSSCFENEKVYTYIQSRFYRSPEVILGMSYGLPIDMWSLGCILAELLTGYPIFPGENEQEQLACIMEIFGPPEKHLIEKSSRKKLFFDSLGKPRVTVSTKGRRRRPSSKTLQQALKCDDEAFLDFIARCLRWDPDRRIKPDEAMLHEFVTGVRKTVRPRPQATASSGVSSPVKRLPSAPTPQQRVRPLPEPPVTSLKNGAVAGSSRDNSSSSPIKGPRRHSTVQGAPSGTGVKRAANGAPLNAVSSLPRAAQRSVSGKQQPDLASAAAIASLKSR